jgi:phospholipid/cholesterol/gamma-HCH transport system substrate-binding protein
MPRTRSLAWAELKIGVLTIVAIGIVAVTIFMLTGGKGFFWQRYSLKTRFANVAGLKPGSPVRVAGKEIGSVTEIEFAGEQIDVTFQVNKEVRAKITTESTATLGSVSLLGEGAVDVTPSSAGTPVPEWGYVKAGGRPRRSRRSPTRRARGWRW